jgi:energy-converting hydrogenase B subunit D
VTVLQVTAIVLVALGGTSVALTRDPLRQVVLSGFYGLALVVLFVALQAPDVALSELVVGSIALPLLVLLALAKVRSRER